MGAPLPEPFKSETLPEMHNGHDHATACGWFPKGYNPATADAPPERGILLTLQVRPGGWSRGSSRSAA